MKKEEIWYRKQIKGLLLIIEESANCENPETMISRGYIVEKLNLILKEGINFHPILQAILDKAEMQGELC